MLIHLICLTILSCKDNRFQLLDPQFYINRKETAIFLKINPNTTVQIYFLMEYWHHFDYLIEKKMKT
ncbi:hypothetical protein C3K47_17325 [Solitalea longa]|uniref:Uncharacterized protein n=1 Tax=Solitalea longa TaxID=2079460 RepID=A0A2S4ZXC6_9SPHI|nr:hypothetical protein C3K47_17325 [Solitalea longa]